MAKITPIAIIGAGPAGLAAAETLGRAGHRVVVFERMPSVGRKFLMAGRGGLNLTHSEPLEDFIERYGSARAHLEPAITALPPADLIAWAESLSQPTFVGSSGRVFPKAMKASPLLRAWLARLAGFGVEIRTRQTWTGWDGKGHLTFEDATGTVSSFQPRATLLALGGGSWPRLGSDGRWVRVLEQAGVAIAPLQPSNAGALIDWSGVLLSKFEGAALKRVEVSVGGVSERGDLVVTRRGLEGGPVYAVSPRLRDATVHGTPATLFVDLKPDVTRDALARRLGATSSKQSLANHLRKALALEPVAISLLREAFRDLPRDPHALASIIKAVPVAVRGVAGLDRAISSAGGVALGQLDGRFMLTARPGTFAAGEMLDWEAPTGGYLLQGCFATGVAAANGMMVWLDARGARD